VRHWFLTVPSPTTSSAAISVFDTPFCDEREHLALPGREPVEPSAELASRRPAVKLVAPHMLARLAMLVWTVTVCVALWRGVRSAAGVPVPEPA